MVEIASYYPPIPPPAVVPPPETAPPPEPTGTGTPEDPAVVIVIGHKDDTSKLSNDILPYYGMTGAQASAAKDFGWAMDSPEARVIAMGQDPNASVGIDEGSTIGDVSEEFFLQFIGGLSDPESYAAPRGVRINGRGSALDDAERASIGLPPRTRWNNVNSPSDVRSVGTYRTGTGTEIRQFEGDAIDMFEFTRDLARAAGAPARAWRYNWTTTSNGMATFKYNDFSATIVAPSATNSGVGNLMINWGGVSTKFKISGW